MFHKRIPALLLAVFLLALPAAAAEVDCDGVYCFGSTDFSGEELAGICITGLPEPDQGAVCLGDRALRPGDILAAEQLEQLTFHPVRNEEDASATVYYLPVFSDRVGEAASLTISIRGKENLAFLEEAAATETYKNLPIDGRLKVKDPEGEAMTFTLVRNPKRGQLELREDGSFTYTPKKNKVGIDSFVYTATDETGKVSREATVTITIVKPTDSTQYTDTVGRDCRFAAEWMKNTGIFVGEKLDGNACFQPERTVSRGEFLAMLVRTLDIPTRDTDMTFAEDVPAWLQPYLAAAIRSGLHAGTPQDAYREPITGEEAAVMIQNALDLAALETAAPEGETDLPDVLQTLAGHGISLDESPLTRSRAALALYQTARLAPDAPGMTIIRKQG